MPVAAAPRSPGPAGTQPGGPRGSTNGYVASRSVVATKTDTSILETAQSISVIGRQQLEDQIPISVNQALRYTPGVSVEQRGGAAASRLDQFFIRGFTAPVFLDGLRQPGSRDANPTVDPYRIERIDIVKGPSSTLYGQSGPGGIVNLTSKVPQFYEHREVFVTAGGFQEVRSGFDVGGVVPNGQPGTEEFSYRVVGLGWKGEGALDNNKVERQFIAPSFTWRPSADTTLTILGLYQKDPFGGSYGALPANGTVFPRVFAPGVTGYFPTRFFDGDRSYEKSDRTQASVTYIFDHAFSENLRFHSAGRAQHSDGLYKSVYTSFDRNGPFVQGPTLFRNNGGTDTDIQAYSIDNYLEGKFETGPLQHKAVVGLDHFYSDTRVLGTLFPNARNLNILAPNYFMGIFGPPYTSRARTLAEQTGVYIQDQITYGGFNLTIGGRYDKARQTGETRGINAAPVLARTDAGSNAFTGKASLLYLFDSGIAPYVAYTEAFEPITAGRIFDSGFGATGRIPDPVKSNQVEAGVKYQPPGTDILLTAAAFEIKRQNALVADQANPGFSVQLGEVQVRGAEFEARVNLFEGLSFIGGVSVLEPKIPQNKTFSDRTTTLNQVTNTQVFVAGKKPVQIPEHTASGFLTYAFQYGPLLGLTIGGGVRHIGEQWGDPANTFKVPSSLVVDALLKYDFQYAVPALKGFDLQINAQNLLDERYVTSCFSYSACYFGPARTLYATLRYRW